MSRALFGVWGIDLDDNAFAKALAGAALRGVHNAVAELSFDAVPPTATVTDATARWQASGARRIEVDSFGALELPWLNAMLARIAKGVSFRRDQPDVAVAWEWPLRIGLLGGDRASELQASLDHSSLQRLVRFVTLSETETECELLLLPHNLRTSVERVLAAEMRISADCVIVLGGAKVEADRIEPLLHTLRTDVRTAGVAVASVPKEQRGSWLHAIVANLAHNTTLDEALRIAADQTGSAAPLLVCSRHLAELARVARYVERVGRTMRRSRPRATITLHPDTESRFGKSVESMGELLERNADEFHYDFERDEAAAVVELRKSVEKATAEPFRVPRMTRAKPPSPPPSPYPEAMRDQEMSFEIAPAPNPATPSPERFVRADVCDEKKPSSRTAIVAAGHPYFLRIRIAPKGGKGAIANAPVDESQLPPSENGHELTIALFELRDGGHTPASQPSQMKIHLPSNRSESSTDAWFPMLTPAKGDFVARVVVLHETRILQTLVLRVPTEATQEEIELTQETIVRPSLEDPGPRRRFDAAIVLNDNDDVPAVMAMTEKSVAYKEPVDIRAAIDAITDAVNQLTKLADTDEITIDDEDVVEVLIELANQGKLLSNWISKNLPAEIAAADRVQILEAREGAFLPLEFVYPSYAPETTAKICPHGKAELAHPTKTKCPNERNRNFVCPAVFWGFSRVLERFPHPPEGKEPLDYRLSTPKADRMKIEPFESALIGASTKVRPDDVTGASGVVASIKPLMKEIFVAGNWDEWTAEIEKHSPSMLLLFPHSEEVGKMPALEIGKKFLKISFLEKEYVRRDDRDPGPVVFLLGCSTTLPRVRFQNFVAGFRATGASIVVGTLTLIRGRHATRFVKEFVTALAKRAGTPDATFGDVLLDVKRTMLAAGDPFALTLVAYGDADWRL